MLRVRANGLTFQVYESTEQGTPTLFSSSSLRECLTFIDGRLLQLLDF